MVLLMMKNIFAGILFAMLWASASVATKIGLNSVQPFVLANIRFILAGIILLIYAKVRGKNININRLEASQLAIYGFLNVTLYLGAFVLAIKHVSAGIGSLSTATNPLFITVFTALFLKKNSKANEWLGLLLGMFGVLLATYPLLQKSYADTFGLIILLVSMLSYSVAQVYFSSQSWSLDRLAINGWQVLFGGFMLLPITLFTTDWDKNTFDFTFFASVGWLIFPVSIIAVTLWLYLLEINPVKAAIWLFLCPIFGFIYSYFLLNEPVSWHTFVGTVIVLLGLFIGQMEKFKIKKLTKNYSK
jgi:probable blue pigment (indigoidine) exporter